MKMAALFLLFRPLVQCGMMGDEGLMEARLATENNFHSNIINICSVTDKSPMSPLPARKSQRVYDVDHILILILAYTLLTTETTRIIVLHLSFYPPQLIYF